MVVVVASASIFAVGGLVTGRFVGLVVVGPKTAACVGRGEGRGVGFGDIVGCSVGSGAKHTSLMMHSLPGRPVA